MLERRVAATIEAARARWAGLSRPGATSPASAPALQRGQYAALPVLAAAAILAPEHLNTERSFAIILIATYLILRSSTGIAGVVAMAAMLTILPYYMDTFERGLMFNIALYSLLGIGLNVVVGYAGLLDLGYVAFFATGSYLYGLLAAPEFGGGFDTGTSFWIVLLMAMVLAGLVGVLLGIPVLRLRGDYLAIVTLGFGEIIRIMLNNEDASGLIGKHVGSDHGLTNGPNGIFSIPHPDFFNYELRGPVELYFVALAGCFIAAFAAERIRDSRVGRAWEAIREDEDVAGSVGVDTTRYKLLAFAIGAAIGGAGGVIFSAEQTAIFPRNFDVNVSINVLALVIISGMGNVRAVVLGAMLLIGLPEVLRDFSVDVAFIHLENLGADYRLVIYGAALVAVMVLRPEGLLPSRRRAAEFEQVALVEAELAT